MICSKIKRQQPPPQPHFVLICCCPSHASKQKPHQANSYIKYSSSASSSALSLNSASSTSATSSTPPFHAQRPSFYQNTILDRYAAKETKRVTLRQLTVFGRNLSEEKLIRSANYVREELPVRLAHRIQGKESCLRHVYFNIYFILFFFCFVQISSSFRLLLEQILILRKYIRYIGLLLKSLDPSSPFNPLNKIENFAGPYKECWILIL